jgi:hypothetical protein
MNHISIEQFKALANIREPNCISIFIPTHRAGHQVNQMLDEKLLKNQLKELRTNLESRKMKGREIDALLKPVEDLLDDSSFWNLQSDGLAIFRTPNSFEYFTLPVPFVSFTFVSDHFYLKPLLPYLNDDGRFYLLALSLKDVKLYEGFPHNIQEMDAEGLLPERLEEAVGYDYKEKHLQFRTGQTGNEQTMYHGHGAGSEEEKDEIYKFFRAVNDGVMQVIKDKQLPLVVAAVDYLVPIYQKANEYKYLRKEFISGNPEHVQKKELHKKAKDLLKDYFSKDKKEKLNAFEEALSNKKASYEVEEVVPAAINQRIDTLFIKKHQNLWGVFDAETNTIITREADEAQSTCLLNLSAIHTLLNGGRVYLLEAENMPEPNSLMNAIYRF